LARHGPTVIGYDGSQAMLESARRAAEAENLSGRIDFQLVPTVERISRPDASLDGCLCLNVLEYLDKPFDCLDEMVRVLRPGGLLVLSVPHTHSPVRTLQVIRNAMKGDHSQSGSSYVALSRFTATEPELRSHLKTRGMDVLMMSGFDGFIAHALLRVLPPSLLFAVAQKASQ
jgi:2-polyprenyl-6-hydroxyphenyl methylase/3-demethylubiquinone-9 3-methyltransferase